MTLTVGSLFSGIGGFDLGLERAGMRVIWQSEIDPYASAVLRKHWPEVPNHGDIRSIRAGTVELPDLICGGFPCQDISVAGAGAGIDGERSGLWKEFARVVGEIRPRYVVVENVGALTTRGLSVVLGDLAALGYDAEWHVIPAAAVDAPHLRERVWIIAHDAADADRRGCERQRLEEHADQQREPRCEPDGLGQRGWRDGTEDAADADRDRVRDAEQRNARGRDDVCDGRRSVSVHDGAQGTAADAACGRVQGHRTNREREPLAPTIARVLGRDDAGAFWREWTTVAPIRGVDDGVPRRMDRHRLHCLGNALVPQIAEVIGRAIVSAAAIRALEV